MLDDFNGLSSFCDFSRLVCLVHCMLIPILLLTFSLHLFRIVIFVIYNSLVFIYFSFIYLFSIQCESYNYGILPLIWTKCIIQQGCFILWISHVCDIDIIFQEVLDSGAIRIHVEFINFEINLVSVRWIVSCLFSFFFFKWKIVFDHDRNSS